MKFLLDTCTFLWLVGEPEKVSKKVMDLFKDPSNLMFFSAVSAWEIGIKYALKKLPLRDPPSMLIPRELSERSIYHLALIAESVRFLETFDMQYGDPFDHILMCQALEEELTILTPDANFRKYEGVKVVW